MLDLEKSLNLIKNHGDWVAIKKIKETTHYRGIIDEKPQVNQATLDEGVQVEVLVDGHFGYAGTTDLSESGIRRAAEKAQKLAQKAAQHKVFSFSAQERPVAKGQYRSPHAKSLDQTSISEIMSVLSASTKAMNINDKIVSRVAYTMMVECEQTYLSSQGSRFEQNFNIVSSAIEATAKEGNEVQSRSQSGGLAKCQQIGGEFFNLDDFKNAGALAAQQALELLFAENTPEEKLDIILAPDQMTLQIHESIGHPLEYDRILGDERNYAGWSFVQPADFGRLQYGSSLMNVTFDPTVEGEMASYLFDECGLQATREYLIKDGVLQRGLGSLESQKRLGLPGVANFRSSSWNRAPIDRMANINLEPGTQTLEEMISKVERGIIMHANRSWSIDDYRNKFQFGCEYAQLIENGRITKTLKNPNYRGTTVAFWNQLAGLTRATETYGSPYCGKGEPNQIIRVGHRSPYALFKNIEVFGA
ncbi:MAG: TldD/PmbA family protein [Bdellovibrionia bacterium]